MDKTQIENKSQTTQLPTKALVTIDEKTNRFLWKNEQELGSAARLAMQMKLAPAHLIKEGLEAVMTAITVCNNLQISYNALQKMFYYKGNITVFGEVYIGLAQRDSNYGDIREFWIDKDYQEINLKNKNLGKEWAAICGVKPKNATEWSYYHFTMDDATKADLYPATKTKWENNKPVGKEPSPDSPWNKYTKDMLMWKARTRAMKAHYSKSLQGIDCYEDVREVIERDVTPPRIGNNGKVQESDLNEAF